MLAALGDSRSPAYSSCRADSPEAGGVGGRLQRPNPRLARAVDGLFHGLTKATRGGLCLTDTSGSKRGN